MRRTNGPRHRQRKAQNECSPYSRGRQMAFGLEHSVSGYFFWESARRQALVGVEGRGAPVASISSGIRCSIYTFAVLQSTALPWGHEIRCWFGLGIRVG